MRRIYVTPATLKANLGDAPATADISPPKVVCLNVDNLKDVTAWEDL
jgi:hypothetical protein